MNKIHLSNISDKLVIKDLLKFVKLSGIDFNSNKVSDEKKTISVNSTGKSIYSLCVQNGNIEIDARIHYNPNECGILELYAHASRAVTTDLVNHCGIRLVDGDTLEITITLESLDFIVYDKLTKYEKLEKFSTPEIIEIVVNKLGEFIKSHEENQYETRQKIVEENYQRTYVESSFARACGVTLEDGVMSNGIGNVKLFTGKNDNLSYYLRYIRKGDELYNIAICLVREIPNGMIKFDISTDIGNNINFQAMKIVYNDEIGDSTNYVTYFAPTSWEMLLDMVSDVVNDDPLAVFNEYEPHYGSLCIPMKSK